MLNYTSETNPFRGGRTQETSMKSATHFINGNISKTQDIDAHWVQRRRRRESGFFIKNPNNRFCDDSSSSWSHTNRKIPSSPYSSADFASLEDMDFMDASSISDDVCSEMSSCLSAESFKCHFRTSTMNEPLVDLPWDLSQKPALHPRPVTIKHHQTYDSASNRISNVSKTEMVMKGEMSGMTLLNALSRRRNIIDDKNHQQEPSVCPKLLNSIPDATFHHNNSVRVMIAKMNDKDKNPGVQEIMVARNKLKRVTTNVSTSTKPLQTGSSQRILFSNTENRNNKTSGSNSVAPTISTVSSRSQDSLSKTSSMTASNSSIKLEQEKKFTVESIVGSLQKDDNDDQLEDRNDNEHFQEVNDNCQTLEEREGHPTLKKGYQSETVNDDHSKYTKMLKMGIPLGAVKNAIIRDGLDPSCIAFDDNRRERCINEVKDRSQTISNISNNAVNAKYTKMLKLGIPIDAVQNAMKRDGVKPSKTDVSGAMTPVTFEPLKKIPRVESYIRTRLHWHTLKQERLSDNSIWYAIKKDACLGKILCS